MKQVFLSWSFTNTFFRQDASVFLKLLNVLLFCCFCCSDGCWLHISIWVSEQTDHQGHQEKQSFGDCSPFLKSFCCHLCNLFFFYIIIYVIAFLMLSETYRPVLPHTDCSFFLFRTGWMSSLSTALRLHPKTHTVFLTTPAPTLQSLPPRTPPKPLKKRARTHNLLSTESLSQMETVSNIWTSLAAPCLNLCSWSSLRTYSRHLNSTSTVLFVLFKSLLCNSVFWNITSPVHISLYNYSF